MDYALRLYIVNSDETRTGSLSSSLDVGYVTSWLVRGMPEGVSSTADATEYSE